MNPFFEPYYEPYYYSSGHPEITIGALIALGVILLIDLVIHIILAVQFRKIAVMKGHESVKYFWFPFLFGLVGILMVVALPDRRPMLPPPPYMPVNPPYPPVNGPMNPPYPPPSMPKE